MPGSDAAKPIRFSLVQPAQPKYRVPVFRELAARPGIRLKLLYGEEPGLPNVQGEGYDSEPRPVRRRTVRGQVFYWHPAQFEFCTRRHTDVLGLTWNTRFLSNWPVLALARTRHVPTVLWGHGFSKNESPRRFRLRMRMARMASAILLYNHAAAEAVVAAGIPRERVFVGLNALDQRPIQAARESWLSQPGRVEAFRREQGLEGKPVFLFVSRLEEANRVDLLLEATAKLQASHPGATAIIVGKGVDEPRLRALAEKLGLGDRARFLGSIYDEAALAGWMLAADVFCYPANIGLSILHAFGYGLPVVTGDDVASHNPEIEALEVNTNGLVFKHGDAASLAQSLARIFDDNALAASMRAAAHKTVMEKFTVQRMVDGIEAAVRYAAAQR